MTHHEPGARQHPPELLRLGLDRLDPVVDVEDLAAAVELAQDRVADEPGRGLGDPGLDRQAVLGRRLDDAHVADPGQGQVERPGDRRGRQGEDVHLVAEPLQALLGGHPEALLLVDDDEPQVPEPDVLREQPVGPDDEVDRAAGQPLDRRLLLAGRDEPRQHPDAEREGREALPEGLVVLGGEDRGRHEDGDLAPVLDRLEGGPDRDLGLAVAHVADDQPVHRPAGLHVHLRLGDGPELVDRLLVGEARLHLGLPGGVRGEGVTLGRGPGGVEAQELLGQIVDGPLDPLLRAQPVGAAEMAQPRPLAAGVAADPLDLLDRDEDPVAAGEAQLEVVALLPRPAASEHLLVAGDPVVDVDDEIAGREPLEDVPRDDPTHRLRTADPDGAEQLAVGDEGDPVRPADEPAVQAPVDEGDRAGRRRDVEPAHGGDRPPGLAEQLRQPRRLVRGEDDPVALLGP